MLYIKTTLEMLHSDEMSSKLIRDGETYHLLTPSLYAWVLQSVHKARQATISGKIPPETLQGIEVRLRAIQDAGIGISDEDLAEAMVRPQSPPPDIQPGLPHPDVSHGTAATPPGTATPPPAETADDQATRHAAVIAKRFGITPDELDIHPVQIREVVIVQAEGFPAMAFTPAEIEWWECWNRHALERWRKEQEKGKEPTKKAVKKQKQDRMEVTQKNALEEGI